MWTVTEKYTLQAQQRISVRGAPLTTMAVADTRDGRLVLASGSSEGDIDVYELDARRASLRLRHHLPTVHDVFVTALTVVQGALEHPDQPQPPIYVFSVSADRTCRAVIVDALPPLPHPLRTPLIIILLLLLLLLAAAAFAFYTGHLTVS